LKSRSGERVSILHHSRTNLAATALLIERR
jgi:hypothetical protein